MPSTKTSPLACSGKPRRRMSSSPPFGSEEGDAGRVAQRFLHRVEIAVVDQPLGDDGHRLRHVAQILLALADGGRCCTHRLLVRRLGRGLCAHGWQHRRGVSRRRTRCSGLGGGAAGHQGQQGWDGQAGRSRPAAGTVRHAGSPGCRCQRSNEGPWQRHAAATQGIALAAAMHDSALIGAVMLAVECELFLFTFVPVAKPQRSHPLLPATAGFSRRTAPPLAPASPTRPREGPRAPAP